MVVVALVSTCWPLCVCTEFTSKERGCKPCQTACTTLCERQDLILQHVKAKHVMGFELREPPNNVPEFVNFIHILGAIQSDVDDLIFACAED